MWQSAAPTALARITNLRSRTDSVCDRTSRAVVVQPSRPMTRMMLLRDWPAIATITICSARSGMTRKKSVKLISTVADATRPVAGHDPDQRRR